MRLAPATCRCVEMVVGNHTHCRPTASKLGEACRAGYPAIRLVGEFVGGGIHMEDLDPSPSFGDEARQLGT